MFFCGAVLGEYVGQTEEELRNNGEAEANEFGNPYGQEDTGEKVEVEQ